MRTHLRFIVAAASFLLAGAGLVQPAAATEGPYKLIKSVRVGGAGGFDYVFADAGERKLYIPRGNRVDVFDLDTLQAAGSISPATSVHGVAVDPQSHHAFCSSNPVVMWDSRTLERIKTIDVKGNPDGILFEPATERIYILSHRAPNVTAIDARDGSIVGTIDLGAAPEEGVSDGQGKVFIDLEDKDEIAAVDAKALKVTGRYALGGKGGTPAGLALDAKNRVLFVGCREPATAVVMNADTGSILTSLPIGAGVDAAEFNPATNEAFSSQRDGTLTVIKENSPTDFAVEQTVPTKLGAKTSTLDSKTNQIFLITADQKPAPAGAPSVQPGGKRARPEMIPDSFTILVVGRSSE